MGTPAVLKTTNFVATKLTSFQTETLPTVEAAFLGKDLSQLRPLFIFFWALRNWTNSSCSTQRSSLHCAAIGNSFLDKPLCSSSYPKLSFDFTKRIQGISSEGGPTELRRNKRLIRAGPREPSGRQLLNSPRERTFQTPQGFA